MSKKARFSAALAATLFWTLFVMVASALAVDRLATWQDNSNNETGFVFQACPDVCTSTTAGWKDISSLLPNVTAFTITGVSPGSTTSYRVGGRNSAGTMYSAIVVDIVPPAPTTPPTAPTQFSFPTCKTLQMVSPGVYQCVP